MDDRGAGSRRIEVAAQGSPGGPTEPAAERKRKHNRWSAQVAPSPLTSDPPRITIPGLTCPRVKEYTGAE